jgi:hypothetical protein
MAGRAIVGGQVEVIQVPKPGTTDIAGSSGFEIVLHRFYL